VKKIYEEFMKKIHDFFDEIKARVTEFDMRTYRDMYPSDSARVIKYKHVVLVSNDKLTAIEHLDSFAKYAVLDLWFELTLRDLSAFVSHRMKECGINAVIRFDPYNFDLDMAVFPDMKIINEHAMNVDDVFVPADETFIYE